MNYRAGAQFERDVVIELRAEGYDVIRAAGSKGKIDVLAFKPGQTLAIQCKLHGTIGPAERAEVLRLAAILTAVPLVAYKEPRQARPHYARLTGPGPKDRTPFHTDEVVNHDQVE